MIDTEGNLKLADFGIAATLNSSSLNFTSSSVLGSGTPPYMSPQQLDGKRPQVTDDIYSVGATFYDLLTSKPPFHQGDISYQVRHTEVSPMSERLEELELANDIPDYVGAIVMACLQKDPAQRPQSMRVIREWIQSGEEVAVEPEKVSPTSARETQRLDVTPAHATGKAPAGGSRKKWAYGIAAAFVVVGLGYWYGLPKGGAGGGMDSVGNTEGREETATKEPEFLKQGLVAYYPFNGNAKDESGNGNDGQPNNVIPTSDRNEKTNAAFGFTGKSLIKVEPSDVHKQPNITINFWMLLRDHETDKLEMLMYREKGFQLFMQKRQTLNFGVCSEGPGWAAPLTVSLDQISKADWVMMTFTLDEKEQCIMMNGSKIINKSNPKPIKYYGSEPLVFGYNAYYDKRNRTPQYFHGRLDDVRIYNRALSEAEVKELYEFEKPKTQ
jgi:hypothetical protein